MVLSQKTTTNVCDAIDSSSDESCLCSSLISESIASIQRSENMKLKEELNEARNQQQLANIRDCSDIFNQNLTASGVYDIYTGPYSQLNKTQVFCDMDTEGGAWTVFQRRQDGSVDFRQNWDTYKNGFGNVSGEHWLGNEILFRLTRNRDYELRVDLEDWEGRTRYATYSHITILSERLRYKLVIGTYSGNAGDALSLHNGMEFITYDRENARRSHECILNIGYGGFWLEYCLWVGVNNYSSHSSSGHGGHVLDKIRWDTWHGNTYSLKSTRMMIRPLD